MEEAGKKWVDKPLHEKLGDVAEVAGDTLASVPANMAVNAATAGAGTVLGGAAAGVSELGKAEKTLVKAEKAAGKAVKAEAEHVDREAAERLAQEAREREARLAQRRAEPAALKPAETNPSALQDTKGKKPTSPGKMQQEVARGQAPRDVERVDPAHAPVGEPHVHFCDGTACNQSGTVHDKKKGVPNPSKSAREWLTKHGWTPPQKP